MTEIVVAGNVVEDETPDGWAPGGPSLYAARMAAALVPDGHVILVTCLPPAYDRTVLAGLDVVAVPACDCPRYRNRYGADGARQQYLLARGQQLTLASERWPARADVLMVAPALDEMAGPPPVAASVAGIALQGLLRRPEPGGVVEPVARPLEVVRPFVQPGVYAFLSEEDTPEPEAFATAVTAHGATVILTRGARGATLFASTGRTELPPVPAAQKDPTGAGDAFAMTFLIRLTETGDLAEATRWALAAGAVATETTGPCALPARAAITRRLAEAGR